MSILFQPVIDISNDNIYYSVSFGDMAVKTTLAHQVGHRIRVRRAEIKMTQAQLASQLGIGQGQMSHLERGNKQLSLARLEQIAQVLKCTPVDLLDDTRTMA
jgi:DNA-binding Xre family transcriptional regulator